MIIAKRIGAGIGSDMVTHRRLAGFTVVELTVILILIGILFVSVAPHFFDRDVFRARGFYDEALSILRYAHKTAIAQRRSVYFNLDAASEQIALCYTSTFPCSTAADQVPGPYGEKPYTVTAASGVDLQTTTATYFFDALGRPYSSGDSVPTSNFSTLTFSIVGGDQTRTITIEGESGYVH